MERPRFYPRILRKGPLIKGAPRVIDYVRSNYKFTKAQRSPHVAEWRTKAAPTQTKRVRVGVRSCDARRPASDTARSVSGRGDAAGGGQPDGGKVIPPRRRAETLRSMGITARCSVFGRSGDSNPGASGPRAVPRAGRVFREALQARMSEAVAAYSSVNATRAVDEFQQSNGIYPGRCSTEVTNAVFISVMRRLIDRACRKTYHFE